MKDSGIYVRMKLLEDLDFDSKFDMENLDIFLNRLPKEGLIGCIKTLCKVIKNIKNNSIK